MKPNRLFLIFFFPFAFHLFCLFFLRFGENFQPRYFEHGFKNSYEVKVAGLDYSKLDLILNQPFHYLDQGMQMVALESADGKYVLKLFNPMCPLKKKWYLKWKNWKKVYSLKWISHEWFQKKARFKKLFKRYQIAFSKMQEETGLVFVHLSPSRRINHFVHVKDRKGKNHIVSLNNTPFVLQEKAILAANYLDKLVEENKIQQLKEAVAQIEELLVKGLQLAITDQIQPMKNNYGFLRGKPIQIDLGRIQVEPELFNCSNEEQNLIIENFHCWLNTRYPNFFFTKSSK